ncbi:MAG: class I SAM-dependent methyltransferase [Ferruginibacter sp.]
MSNIYQNHTYLKHNPHWHETDAAFKTDYIQAFIEKHISSIEIVGEVGCGSGEILVELSKRISTLKTISGYDIAPDAIRIAEKKSTEKIHFFLEDITEENHPAHFDVLLVIDVLEHLENYFQFLAAIKSKSTYTIFHIPLDMSVRTLFKEQMLIEAKERIGHIHLFTEDFIKSVLLDHGYTIIDSCYTPPRLEQISFKERCIQFFGKLLFGIHQKFCTKFMGGYSIMILAKNRTV